MGTQSSFAITRAPNTFTARKVIQFKIRYLSGIKTAQTHKVKEQVNNIYHDSGR